MPKSKLARIVTISTHVYSRALWLCPRRYRREYGPLMLQAFRDLCWNAYRQGGAAKVVRAWWLALLDLCVTASAEHLAALRTGALVAQAAGVALLAVLIAAIVGPALGPTALQGKSGDDLLTPVARPSGDGDLVGLVPSPPSGDVSRSVAGAGLTAGSRQRRPATSLRAFHSEQQAAIMEAQPGATDFTFYLPDGQVVQVDSTQPARVQVVPHSQARLLVFR